MKTTSRAWIFLGLAAIVAITCGFLIPRRHKVLSPDLPPDREIVRISAMLVGKNGNAEPIPEFRVPDRYVPLLMAAFRPARRFKYARLYDDLAIGRLQVVTRDGRTTGLAWGFVGKNPLCFTFAGAQFIHDVPWERTCVVQSEGHCLYAAHCIGVESLLIEIHQELLSGRENTRLCELLTIWRRESSQDNEL